MTKTFRFFIVASIIFSIFSSLCAKDIPFSTKGVLKALETEVKAFQKQKVVDVPLPKYDEANWKIHVLAENEAISDVIEVSGQSLVYIGAKLFTEKLIIHGDGILFVNGELICPEIDIKGNAIVIFNNNKVKYYGGNIKIGSGLIAARKGNNLNVHIRKNGTLYAGEYNNGSIVANGQVTVHVKGPQKGDILIGEGNTRPAKIFVAGDLTGRLTGKQNCDVEVGGTIKGDISIVGNLKIKGGDFVESDMKVTGTLTGDLKSVVSEKDNRSEVTVGTGTLKITNSAEATVLSTGNFAYSVGKDHTGSITTTKGNLTVAVTDNCVGNIKSGANANYKGGNFKGLFTVNKNATIVCAKVFESYMLKTGGACSMKSGTFKGNADIGGKGTLVSGSYLTGGFYHDIKMNNGSIEAEKDNELEIAIAKTGVVKVGKDNKESIKIGGKGTVSVGGTCKGTIVIVANGDVSVAKVQESRVNIGGDGKVNIGKAKKSIVVVKNADITIGNTLKSYFDDSIISIGTGKIKVNQQNVFDVIARNKAGAASLTVGFDNNGDVTMAGKGNIKVGRDLTGAVKVIGVAVYASKNQFGKMYFGNTVKCDITQKLEGNLYVADNQGKSYLNIGHIIDSNIGIHAWAAVKTIEAIDVKSERESIHIETGSLIADQNIEANISAEKEIHVQARNIYGNVEIGDENSRVDAIIKGKMKIGL